MDMSPETRPFVDFRLAMIVSPDELGRFWASETKTQTVFLFSFGTETASHCVEDGWTACCELYLQAHLEEQGELHRLCLGGSDLFTVADEGDVAVCSWSEQLNFAVRKEELVSSITSLVDSVVAKLPADRSEDFIHLGASMIEEELRFAPLKTGGAVH